MVKVFLVEDEIVVREGIKNKIDWQTEGLVFSGEASDGELAYPMICAVKPDIVITDIKMPFVDGLELSRMLKEKFPEIKIIILSGYGEFEYAKEAIGIGVTEYLLKPISSEKLLEAVKNVALLVEKEKEQKNLLEQFEKEMQEGVIREKQQFFYDLVSRKIPLKDLLEQGKKLDMNLVACIYNIVLFKIGILGDREDEYSTEIVELSNAIEAYVKQYENVELFERYTEGSALLFMTETEEESEKLIKQVTEGIVGIIGDRSEIYYFFGIGRPVQRLREMEASFHEASRAFSCRFFGMKNRITSYADIGKMQLFSEESIDLRQVDCGKLDRKILDNFLRSGFVGEINHFIEDYFTGLGSDNIKSFLFRQYITMDIYFAIISFVESMNLDLEKMEGQLGDVNLIAGRLESVEGAKAYLEEILTTALELRDGVSRKKYEDILSKARTYIDENYEKSNISLNTVAAAVNISPSYFSSIFSQEMGQTFIEYLTGVRMEKAKELLMCTGKKTSDIGFEVGYKDSHYFSYLFRKLNDCSPKEFRTRGQWGKA